MSAYPLSSKRILRNPQEIFRLWIHEIIIKGHKSIVICFSGTNSRNETRPSINSISQCDYYSSQVQIRVSFLVKCLNFCNRLICLNLSSYNAKLIFWFELII